MPHIRAGRVYAAAMALVCVTALPLAMLGANVVLLLVARLQLLSRVRRLALRPQRERPAAAGGNWTAAVIMALTGLGMWGYGAVLFLRGDSQWVTMARVRIQLPRP